MSGLSPNTTEDSLNDFFSKHGKLKTRARIAVNRAGQSKVCCFLFYVKTLVILIIFQYIHC